MVYDQYQGLAIVSFDELGIFYSANRCAVLALDFVERLLLALT